MPHLVALLTVAFALSAADYEWGWVPVGGGGNLMTLHFHPTTPDWMVLRSDVGGNFVRTPAGTEAWRSLLLSASLGLADRSMREPSGFAFDPRQPEIMYATCEAGVYRSPDAGKTWVKIHDVDCRITHHTRYHLELIAVDAHNPQVIWLGTYDKGLQRTLDGGKTWTVVTDVPIPSGLSRRDYGISTVVIDPRPTAVAGRSAEIHVGVLGEGIYRSIDGGDSFTTVSGTKEIGQPFHMRLDPLGGLYVSTGNGLYRCENGHLSANLLAGARGFDVDLKDGNRLVVVTNEGIKRSTDRGATWTLLVNELGEAHGWWQAWKNPWGGPHTITLDPHRPGRAIFLTCYMCYQVDDIWGPTTMSWNTWHQGIEETVSFEIMTPPGSPYFYTGFGDIFGLRHRNLIDYPGQDDRTPGHVVPSYDYFPGDVNDIWHVRVGGSKYHGLEVFRSRDAGSQWSKVTNPFGKENVAMGAIAVSATDPDNIVVCSALNKNANAYSRDGGTTWVPCKSLPNNLMGHNPNEYWYFGNILVADKVDPFFYAYQYRSEDGHQGKLWRSVDGAEWSVAAEGLPSSSKRQKFISLTAAPQHGGWLILSTDFANVALVSRDHGTTWTPIPGFERMANADFGAPAPGRDVPTLWVNGQLQGAEYGISRSDDFFATDAATWTYLSDPAFPLLEPREVRGCKQEYGRVFVSEAGRGFIYGRIVP